MWNFKYSIFDIQHLIFDIQYLISNIISNIRNGKGGKSGWFDHCEWNVLQICKCGKCGRSGKCVTNWHWQNPIFVGINKIIATRQNYQCNGACNCNWNFNCNCNCNCNQLLIIDWNTYIVVIQLCIWIANAVIHHFVFKSLNVIVILIVIVIVIRSPKFQQNKFILRVKICFQKLLWALTLGNLG